MEEHLKQLVEEGKSEKELCEIFKISKPTLHKSLRKLNLSLRHSHFNEHIFDCIDSPEKAYWLGFLYADGHIHTNRNKVSLCLCEKDKNHLEKFRNFIQAKRFCSIRQHITKLNGKSYINYKISCGSKHLKETLISLGCVPKKSLIITFPKLDIFTNFNFVYDFIRGYVDGDGCLYFTPKGNLNIEIIGTPEFLMGIKQIFPNKFSNLLGDKRWTEKTKRIVSCGYNSQFVSDILYKNATIYLDRKYKKYITAVQLRN